MQACPMLPPQLQDEASGGTSWHLSVQTRAQHAQRAVLALSHEDGIDTSLLMYAEGGEGAGFDLVGTVWAQPYAPPMQAVQAGS